MPQLRQNIVTGDWVVVAPERAKRPHDFIMPKKVKNPDKSSCPFCEGTHNYYLNERVRKASTGHTYVMENRYPAFIENESEQSNRSFYPESGFYRARGSVGSHEIVVIKDHDLYLPIFPKVVMQDVLETFRNRYHWMAQHEDVVSIMPIYNHGSAAGASLDHPHAQIFASGIVANTVGRELDGANRYYGINDTCVYCDIITHELEQNARIVYENSHFIALNFYASRFPFETWILPKKHESQFEETSGASMEDLADAMMEVLAKLNKTLDNPPLNFYIHTLPTIEEDSNSFHWHVEIVPRVTTLGGFEMGSEVIINVMPPEEAAHYLAA